MSYLFQAEYSLERKINEYEFKPKQVEYEMPTSWLDLFTSLITSNNSSNQAN